jgi:hypothetical protein
MVVVSTWSLASIIHRGPSSFGKTTSPQLYSVPSWLIGHAHLPLSPQHWGSPTRHTGMRFGSQQGQASGNGSTDVGTPLHENVVLSVVVPAEMMAHPHSPFRQHTCEPDSHLSFPYLAGSSFQSQHWNWGHVSNSQFLDASRLTKEPSGHWFESLSQTALLPCSTRLAALQSPIQSSNSSSSITVDTIVHFMVSSSKSCNDGCCLVWASLPSCCVRCPRDGISCSRPWLVPIIRNGPPGHVTTVMTAAGGTRDHQPACCLLQDVIDDASQVLECTSWGL